MADFPDFPPIVQSVHIVSVEPSANQGWIQSSTVIVKVSSYNCSYYNVKIDNSSCSPTRSSSFICNGADGAHTITAICHEQNGTGDSRQIQIDAHGPNIHSFTLTGVEKKGSISNDKFAQNIKKIVGLIKIQVSATDAGIGMQKVGIYLGNAGINSRTQQPESCTNYALLGQISPNPMQGNGPYEWTWDSNGLGDDRFYCLAAIAYDKLDQTSSSEIVIVVNNKCDKDNDGFISPEKFDLGCKRVVCLPTDWFCNTNSDCNDNRDNGGYYARPYDTQSSRDYYESLFSPKSYYDSLCSFPTGCPACDDELDNDCDGLIDLKDTNCLKTCDQDQDHYFNVNCLRPANWQEKGDCNDKDIEMNFGFEESFDNPACIQINCCNDKKDNDCDGQIDECDWKKDCDKDSDRYIAEECSPESKSEPLPQGFLDWDDCNDNDPNVYPSAKKETEYVQGCDGTKDNNCDKTKDEKDQNCIDLCDRDGDGYFNFYDKNWPLSGHNYDSLKVCGGKFEPETPPSVPTLTVIGSGNVGPGTYYYKITFLTPRGETEGSKPAKIVLTESSKVKISNIATGNPFTVTARKIYRTPKDSNDYKFLTSMGFYIGDAAWTYFIDNIPDEDLGTDRIPLQNLSGSNKIITGGKGHDGMDVLDSDHPNIDPKDVNSGVKEKGSLCEDEIDNDSDGLINKNDPDCVAPPGVKIYSGLVPCGREYDDPETVGNEADPCTVCHFFYLLQRIVAFIRNLAFIVAPILIVICGVMFIVAAGNVELLKKAKQGMTATVVGIVIILLAWVIVSMLFKAVGSPVEGKHWYEIQCETQ